MTKKDTSWKEELLCEKIASYLKTANFQQFKIESLKQFLKNDAEMKGLMPKMTTVCELLRRVFHLRYKNFDT